MKAGRLNRRVAVQALMAGTNTQGEAVKSYVQMDLRWAGVEPLSQKELVDDVREQPLATHRIVLRQDTLTRQISPNWRITWGGNAYDIRGVARVRGKDADLHLLAVERVGEAL